MVVTLAREQKENPLQGYLLCSLDALLEQIYLSYQLLPLFPL